MKKKIFRAIILTLCITILMIGFSQAFLVFANEKGVMVQKSDDCYIELENLKIEVLDNVLKAKAFGEVHEINLNNYYNKAEKIRFSNGILDIYVGDKLQEICFSDHILNEKIVIEIEKHMNKDKMRLQKVVGVREEAIEKYQIVFGNMEVCFDENLLEIYDNDSQTLALDFTNINSGYDSKIDFDNEVFRINYNSGILEVSCIDNYTTVLEVKIHKDVTTESGIDKNYEIKFDEVEFAFSDKVLDVYFTNAPVDKFLRFDFNNKSNDLIELGFGGGWLEICFNEARNLLEVYYIDEYENLYVFICLPENFDVDKDISWLNNRTITKQLLEEKNIDVKEQKTFGFVVKGESQEQKLNYFEIDGISTVRGDDLVFIRTLNSLSFTDLLNSGIDFLGGSIEAFEGCKGLTYNIEYRTNLKDSFRTLYANMDATKAFDFDFKEELEDGEYVEAVTITFKDVPKEFALGDQVLFKFRLSEEVQKKLNDGMSMEIEYKISMSYEIKEETEVLDETEENTDNPVREETVEKSNNDKLIEREVSAAQDNPKWKAPETDDSNLMLWILASIISAGAIIWLLSIKKANS